MNKISGTTFFIKKVFPLLWFSFLAFFIFMGILHGAMKQNPIVLIMPIFMAVFGLVLMKKLVWDLMDEVYDCGDHLLIKNYNQTDQIYLADIINLSASTLVNPPQIKLKLRQPSKFGDEVAFLPKVGLRLNPFARIKIADDLILRIDQARLKLG